MHALAFVGEDSRSVRSFEAQEQNAQAARKWQRRGSDLERQYRSIQLPYCQAETWKRPGRRIARPSLILFIPGIIIAGQRYRAIKNDFCDVAARGHDCLDACIAGRIGDHVMLNADQVAALNVEPFDVGLEIEKGEPFARLPLIELGAIESVLAS